MTFYILADERNDWSVIEGITEEQSNRINKEGLKVFCAPRPLTYIWYEDNNRLQPPIEGISTYDPDLWFTVAVNLAGQLYGYSRTVCDSLIADKAEEVKVITYEDLEGFANGVLHNDPEYIEPSIEYYGKDVWAIQVTRNARWAVIDRRNNA